MISEVTGKITFYGNGFLILHTGGLGFKIFVSEDTLREIGKKDEEKSIFTHLSVRENALDLYGFISRQELSFFELLLTVSGIGPKTALSVMNLAPIETLLTGIASGDSTYFTKVSGLGKKTAQKIILELQEKVGGISHENTRLPEEDDVLEAIQALGYTPKDAREVVKEAAIKEAGNTQEKIRAALKILGKK